MIKITSETKLFLGVTFVTATIIVIGVLLMSRPAKVWPRNELLLENTATRGNRNAKTFLVEFSDFQCPACKNFKPIIDEIVNQNEDNIVFAYRHFPLDQHKYALKAAQAAEAAGDQGKFWQMYELLFDNQDKFSDGIFAELAKKLDLDMDKFNQAMDDPQIKAKILNDRNYGEKIGVGATPTFYLNGQKIIFTSIEDFKKQISPRE